MTMKEFLVTLCFVVVVGVRNLHALVGGGATVNCVGRAEFRDRRGVAVGPLDC